MNNEHHKVHNRRGVCVIWHTKGSTIKRRFYTVEDDASAICTATAPRVYSGLTALMDTFVVQVITAAVIIRIVFGNIK